MNINQLMKQAQQMQKKMAEMENNLGHITVEGAAGGGLVKIQVNGKNILKSIKIDPSLLSAEEGEVLEDLIIAAYNDAKAKLDIQVSEEMSKVTGGLNLPAGMKFPF